MSDAREDLLDRVVAWLAEHGAGDTSMRTLAAGLGTSHRMLHYHFGSREALLGTVVERVERRERDALAALRASTADPFEAGMAFWARLADTAQVFAPLYFELAGHAMLSRPYARSWRRWLAEGWSAALARLFLDAGAAPDRAEALARLSLAQARGLLFELALTGDRPAADAAMRRFATMLRAEAAAAAGGAGQRGIR
ncbi:TetR/AcrR family transcriptional regulator [Streptomonospora nanhaiensis]|uniref:AcrR family transcriptional regulator n=1 Tax=Streptomonospora nanhaiensis TaxID=1323731 RepID=A0A853BYD9_9ACTN|nr:TetR/AcrR family transcriptional regulator [Streptomonospora nanhaiensis]MBV2364480.1 TetR/AcrR family transcriptional regulator [Streptomonospora nanhaiensis]MBX9390602.1 TetR/AcrR family transcriptional regulator [Streptomonospora nanhaiensis]NYI99172.1 AcrR family transcriptional regulator [Streptomonospora nanhaiensis]